VRTKLDIYVLIINMSVFSHKSLDTTLCDKNCGWSLVFSGYSGFLHQ